MKKIFLVNLSLIFLLTGCGKNRLANVPDYNDDETVYTPAYSKNFDIRRVEDSSNVVITSKNPWQGANEISTKFYILKDGFQHEKSSDKILDNAQRIVCMSSTHVAMLKELQAADRIVAVSGKEYISDTSVASDKNIPDIGYEGNIDYETLVSVRPDLVLLFSVNGSSSMEPKLKELGIPFIYVGDYVEDDPLGKAEWIVPVAELIGKRDEGLKKFKEIETKYNALKNKVEEAEFERPSVMVNAPFNGAWYMPSSTSYVARLIEDAGGSYLYGKDTGNSSLPIDLEQALNLVSQANYWINIGSVSSLEEFKTFFPKFEGANCVRNGNLYNNNLLTTPAGGNDCYETGAIHPEIVLKDLIKIFHPELVDKPFTFYHRLQ